MKYIIVLFSLFYSSHAFAQPQTIRALFLGNSYTYVNNLPQIIADMASSTGDTLIFDSHTIGGYSLYSHLADTASTNKIKAGGWDYVILQDQSQAPALEDYGGGAGASLSSLIKKYNPCARTLFYMTWGRKNGDAVNCPDWPPVCTYAGMDSLLYLRYMEMAAVNHAEVSPVGAVWKSIRQNYPLIELYQSDESHPSAEGSYAAACCFYASLFKKDPLPVPFNYVINSMDAAVIRNAAKIVVYDSLLNWFFAQPIPIAEFDYFIGSGSNEVHLINHTLNADTYQWDFGDGNFSATENPVHNYLSDGTFTITLTASNCDQSIIQQATWQKPVTFCPFTPTIVPVSLTLCPGSMDTLWTQPYDSYQWFDSNGDALTNETKQYLSSPGSGYYTVLTSINGCGELSQQALVNSYHPMYSLYVNESGNIIPPDTVCMGDTLKLILTPNKPPYPLDNNVQWFFNGTPIPNSANDTLNVTETGSYQVFLTDTIDCPGYVIFMSGQIFYAFKSCTMEPIATEQVVVYPNPSADFIVKITSGLIGTSYSITDIIGREVQTGRCDNELNTLILDGISSGMYLLKIDRLNGHVVKLIRQ